MLKTVVLDIDDTLYNYKSADQTARAVACACAEQELGVPSEVLRERYQCAMDAQFRDHIDQVGCHSRAVRFQMALEELKLPLRYAPILEEVYWNALLRVMQPMPGAADFLRKAHRRGMRLGVCTNMSAQWQIRKLERLGMLELMDFFVSSEEAGAEKPDGRIFQLCMDKAGCLPEEGLMIGDDLEKDVLGAQSFGMAALWFHPGSAPEALSQGVKSISTFCGLIDHINISSKGERNHERIHLRSQR